jgi:hypothetical protein
MMVLPFTPHILGLVLKNEKLVNEHYEIEYRTGNETEDLVLYTTTSALDKGKMTAILRRIWKGKMKSTFPYSKGCERTSRRLFGKPFLRVCG